MTNPLVDDRLVDFLITRVHDIEALTKLKAFAHHDKETFALFIAGARRLAREKFFPLYKALDENGPTFDGKRVKTHPALATLYRGLIELGTVGATSPTEAGGQGMPELVNSLASSYLMAANLSAYCYAGLTSGAAGLIETFGTEELNLLYRAPMLEGRFTGTMALTEPQAGSSLADVKTRARPMPDGSYRIKGSKIFISGGDNSFSENIVHLLLARIEGAPSGSRGISLFVVPRERLEGASWVDNDVTVAGMIHKIGWKGLPSLALEFGDREDCHGYLVGEPNRGLAQMFQMMNEARLMVGMNAAATASVAFHEARQYARDRSQGRLGAASEPPVPIIEHPDVRRMLLRQQAIVSGAFALLAETARFADLAAHSEQESEREKYQLLVDLLIPIAKSFPAEWGFESNALALQIHGGYGYSSEFLPEAFLRDQKLNSIHEGTTGIQALDLVGRKALAKGGEALRLLGAEVVATIAMAKKAGVDEDVVLLERAIADLAALTAELGARGARGDASGMFGHASDYLAAASIIVVGWQWLKLRAFAATSSGLEPSFVAGIEASCRYWLRTEVPKSAGLIELCRSSEDSYLRVPTEAL